MGTYCLGEGEQHVTLTQTGNEVEGMLLGEIYRAPFKGTVHGSKVKLNGVMGVSGSFITWQLAGAVSGGTMSGKVNPGEYGEASWNAVKV